MAVILINLLGVALSLVVGVWLQTDAILPASCWGCNFLPLLHPTLAFASLLRTMSQASPCSGGCSHPSWPHLAALHRAVGAGIWKSSWHTLTVVSCQPAGAPPLTPGPGIPLDCSPQTLGQEVAARRARQRLEVGMEGGKREAMSWRYLAGGQERDSF